MQGKSVLIVDQEAATRESMRRLLDSAAMEVRDYESAEAALEAFGAMPVDCLIANNCLSGMSAIDLYRELALRGFRPPMILVADPGHVSEAVRAAHAMRRRIADIIEKPIDEAVLLESVLDALDVEEPHKLESVPDRAAVEALARLTPRERQVLSQLVNGATNRRIAESLGISYRTVEVYRTRILLKTQARNFSGLIRIAVMGGMDSKGTTQ